MTINEAINHPDACIVDVRTEGEFAEGCVEGSINIPLHEVPDRVDDIKALSRPLILCCQSGARSAQALLFLQSEGVDGVVMNGGGYGQVQIHLM